MSSNVVIVGWDIGENLVSTRVVWYGFQGSKATTCSKRCTIPFGDPLAFGSNSVLQYFQCMTENLYVGETEE